MRQATIALLLIASPAHATKYEPPKRHDVFSHNWAFVLDVNPDTKAHTVYDVRDRSKPLWSFTCAVWHFPFFVSDDGLIVATVGWKYVQEQDIPETKAVTFWNKDGEFRSHPLRDLCPDPPRTKDVGVGVRPIGDIWRTWYTEVKDDGDSFTIHTTCGVEYRFRYADGELVASHYFAYADEEPLAAWRVGWRPWSPWILAVGGLLALMSAGVVLWYCRRRHRRPGCSNRRDAGPTLAIK